MTYRCDTEHTQGEYPTERRAQLAADVLTMLGKGPVVVWDAGDEGSEGPRKPQEPICGPRASEASTSASGLLRGLQGRKSKESA